MAVQSGRQQGSLNDTRLDLVSTAMTARHGTRQLSNLATGLVFGGCAVSMVAFAYAYVTAFHGKVGTLAVSCARIGPALDKKQTACSCFR